MLYVIVLVVDFCAHILVNCSTGILQCCADYVYDMLYDEICTRDSHLKQRDDDVFISDVI